MNQLFKITGFTPYIIIIFLNAMTDLGHKIILQNTIFKAYDGSDLIVLTAVVNALILLPFIFLFSPSGFISDKYSKTKVIKYASLAAIFITIFITISYYLGLFWLSFALTFVLAAQSAIYSPAKYGLIKQMVGNENLASANGLVQAVTIISILAGSVIYSIFFEILLDNGTIIASEILPLIAPLGYMLIFASVIEYLLARRLLKKVNDIKTNSELTFDTKNYRNLIYLKENMMIIKKTKLFG